jgi:predicted Zn-dependent peptidase
MTLGGNMARPKRLLIWAAVIITVAVILLTPFKTRPRIILLNSGGFGSAYLVRDESASATIVNLIIQSGEAKNPYAEGLAHYVEHLAWLNAYKDSQRSQRHSNAFTDSTSTHYISLETEASLATQLHSLVGVLRPISLPVDFMEQERTIVEREFDLRVSEDPFDAIRDERVELLFGQGPISRSVIGTKSEIRTFSLDDARKLHAATHTMDKATLLIWGNVSKEEAEAAIVNVGTKAELASKTKIAPADNIQLYPFIGYARIVKSVQLPKIAGESLLFSKLIQLEKPIDREKLEFTADALRLILDSTDEGGIAKDLRFDNFIARNYAIDINVLSDRVVELSFEATPDRGVMLEKLQSSFEDVIKKLADKGVSASSFTKVQSLYQAPDEKDLPRKMFDYAFDTIIKREVPTDYNIYLDKRSKVSRSNVDQLLKAIAGDGRVVAFHIGPVSTPALDSLSTTAKEN